MYVISAKIDTTHIEKAVNLSNELIEKLKVIQTLSKELNDYVEQIDFKVNFSETREDI